MPVTPATDFRPVILGGDITAYSLVRTFHEAYGVRPLVVNMTDGGPIALSRLCDHVYVPGLEDADVFVGSLEKVAREHQEPGVPLLLVAAGDWYVRMIIENKDRLGRLFTIPYIDGRCSTRSSARTASTGSSTTWASRTPGPWSSTWRRTSARSTTSPSASPS